MNKIHEKVLDFIISYRISNPDFVCWLRQRDRNNRLTDGYWFQGNENYAFVGLYNASGGSNMTRSIGLSFWYDKSVEEEIGVTLEVVYNDETDDAKIKLYADIISTIGGFEKKTATKYTKLVGYGDDVFTSAAHFLDIEKPKIDQIINSHNLQEFFIDKTFFEQQLDNIVKKRSSERNYFVVGTSWEDNGDQIDRFLNEGIWENGYDDKFADVVNSVKEGDRLAIKSTYAKRDKSNYLRIKRYGTVVKNYNNGRQLDVQWDEPMQAFDIEGLSKYRSTIHKVQHEDIKPIFFPESSTSSNKEQKQDNNMNHPLNTILYGPPGTGKTYNTINYAVAIADGRKIVDVILQSGTKEGRDALEEVFEDYRKSGQIEFITFHQNYSYEEFVQGLRPDISAEKDGLSFQRVDGIFKKLADRALANKEAASKSVQLLPTFDDVFDDFFREVIEEEKEKEIKMESKGYHFTLTRYNEQQNNFNFRKRDGGTAHNIYIPTLRAFYDGVRSDIQGMRSYYLPLAKAMKEHAKQMVKDKPAEQLKRYVLIIDEINRANISRVFGELITLIEPDKRWGGRHQMKLALPSGHEFTVPDNLYIIGTMNTADKSLALLDIALRRRFSFKPMFPDETKVYPAFQQFFKNLNNIVYEEKGADFTIGHSYFMAKDNAVDPDIVSIMNNEVIPLLQEYYYSDKKDKVREIINKALENTPLSGYEVQSESFGLIIFISKASATDGQ